MTRRFSVKQVSEKLGLEESEIRYYESVFKEFLSFTEMGLDRNGFTEDHVSILSRIKDLIYKRGFTVDEVKRELKSSIKDLRGPAKGSVRGEGHARVIAITSGKGGVGKTSVTVNLAVEMASRGKRVAIFDADLGLANVHILMGVKPRFNLAHLVQNNFSLEDVVARGPLGIRIVSGGQGVREMSNQNDEQRRFLLRQIDSLEKEVDVLLVDTGAGISENVLRFATFADEVIAVTTPNIAANADCFSIIKILHEMEPNSKIGVITNMARDMYEAKNVFNRLGAACQKMLDRDLSDLGYISECEEMRRSVQERRPVMMSFPDCPAAVCVREVVDTIFNRKVFINAGKQSSFGDLMGALRRNMAGTAAVALN
jgi:flagellar biosynthesis protein FlhG